MFKSGSAVLKKMLFYFYGKRNLNFLLASCFFMLLNYWVYAAGLAYGALSLLLGKKY